ncbi:spermatogenesis-defective protein 39 homolog [Vespa crabro]|uniref:spermatogenesis-defective protein 39 homolog n=1 Tax=Vespa crabro TaxID=7445 RepID=UPI001F0103FC|nr:spermatogenesis-defective protein 39 homolog [Vespa crabro]
MSITKDEENYWDDIEKNFFCFESNEVDQPFEASDIKSEILGTDVSFLSTSKNYIKSNNDLENLKPLLSVISEKTLHCILALDKIQNIDQRPNDDVQTQPDVTLRRILMGQSYSLEQYKSLASKTALLDSAVKSGNGNAILIIVLFLIKTLKKSLVYRLLAERPEVVNVYIHYLSTKLQTNEITDILSMLGQLVNSAMINLHIILKNTQDCDKLLQKLRNCYKTQFLNLVDCKETQFLHSYIQLLEWHVALRNAENSEKIEGNWSVLDFLRYICKNDKHSSQSAVMFSQQHDISPKQYQKIVIEVKASLGEWETIDRLLLTKGWLGNKKLQTSLPIEDIVKLFHRAQAPLDILERYLKYVDNIDKRLELAKSFNCYRIAIDIFVMQGDQTALLEYKSKLQPQSEEYFYATSALRIPSVKWKN